MASRRVLIVGGVAGGASCATRLRRLDEHAEIFIFERGPDVSFANCGLPYYVGGVIQERQKLLLVSPERFRDWFKIEVRIRHAVRQIDRGAKTIQVENLQTGATSVEPYDHLVLSTGASPIRPKLPGVELPGIFTVRNLEDVDGINAWILHRKAARAVVVGGGFLGLEMAENLARRRMEVSLLEMRDQVMPGMDQELVAPVHDELRRQGVDLALGQAVAGFEAAPEGRITVVTQAGQRHTGGVVILAMGVRPDVQLARSAGLEIGSLGGMRVDDQMRTTDPAIFAVGDAVEIRDFITGQPAIVPLAGPANRQGRTAADVIAGRDVHFRGVQATSVVGVFDLTLAMTGATEKALRRADIPFEKSYTHSLHRAGYYPGGEMMMLKLLVAPDTGRILGAQAVGKAGVEKRVDVLALAIQKQATVYDLEEAELCYAPQYGSAKDPINMAGFVAANILRGDVQPAQWSDWLTPRAAGQETPVVLDVRNREEAAAGAVPGSINIPLGELRSRLGELPRNSEIWVHCGVGQRGYYAARILRQHGFDVRNLSGGFRTYSHMAKPG